MAVSYLKTGDLDRAKERFLDTVASGARAVYVTWSHYYIGIIYSREGAPAKAIQEFEWCIPRAEEARIPNSNLYGWLAKVSEDLGLKADAERYDNLAKSGVQQG